MIAIFFLLCSCSNNTAIEEALTVATGDLAKAKSKIASLEAQIEPEGELVHLVFLNTKSEIDRPALLAEIKKLEAIPGVMDLEVGPFEDLGDSRAMSQFGYLLQMSLAEQAAYNNYQKHPIHLRLKENLGPYLAGPPVTYDFMKK